MAQIAKNDADKANEAAKNATDNVADLGKRAVDRTADVAREATDRGQDVLRRGAEVVERTAGAVGDLQREVAQRSTDGTAELGRALVELASEQTRHNLETFSALTQTVDWGRVSKAVDWDRVVKIQSEYVRVSLERAAQLTQRYVEVSQAVLRSTAAIAQRQAKKAA